MAFHPSADVILEVLNAADPSRASAAAERLATLARSRALAADFAADLDSVAFPSSVAASSTGLPDARARIGDVGGGADREARAKTDFEAMALGPFVSELLPKETTGLFGGGAAGDMWRSMFADEIAKQIAKSGALGLSRKLFASHPLLPARQAAHGAASAAALMSENILAASASVDLGNSALLSARRKQS